MSYPLGIDPLRPRNFGEAEALLDRAEKAYQRETGATKFEFAIDALMISAEHVGLMQPQLTRELLDAFGNVLTNIASNEAEYREAKARVGATRTALLAALEEKRTHRT